MSFTLPAYTAPDFSDDSLVDAPVARFEPCEANGIAPEGFHATSVFPEYVQVSKGRWVLLEHSRMDCVIRKDGQGKLDVVEFRRLREGDLVGVGRGENGEDGFFVHTCGFHCPEEVSGGEKFAFRTTTSRETAFSIDYDTLYDVLRHDRENGYILWVGGPAVIFDSDSRSAFSELVEKGYVHGLLAGNALATHDLEGALYETALGQGIYNKHQAMLGHYHHLDAINTIKRCGGIAQAVRSGEVKDGVMKAVVEQDVDFVLAGSIRDDGPLPEVTADVYAAQDKMRALASRATTVIALATQLHTIATGNMTPSYQVQEDGVRPVYFFIVDMSEFAANKLGDRGSLTAHAILTNVQDFVVNLNRALD